MRIACGPIGLTKKRVQGDNAVLTWHHNRLTLAESSCTSYEHHEDGSCCGPVEAADVHELHELHTPSRSVSLEFEGTERLRDCEAGKFQLLIALCMLSFQVVPSVFQLVSVLGRSPVPCRPPCAPQQRQQLQGEP